MSTPILALSTVSNQQQAEALARLLVESHAAACVSILPSVHSVYRWQGEVETGQETMLLIKSTASQTSLIQQILNDFHATIAGGYELPELITLPITGGSPAYLAWLLQSAGQN